jgi:cyclohexyl-isocyanide hydratase
MRWLFHVLRTADVAWGQDGRFRPAGLAAEGFIHASYKERAEESARLYFAEVPEGELRVLAIDPRRLDVPVDVATTPRGAMPHVRGAVPCDAITVLPLDAIADHPDSIGGTRIGVAAFEGMTLLDLVGPLDALGRIASMGFDPTTTCEVFALTRPAGDGPTLDVVTWRGATATFTAGRFRPHLDAYDVLVLPGGPGARALAAEPEIAAYLATYPENRLLATVCTGALLAGAAGRLQGRTATTHRSALGDLATFGATAHPTARVVADGNVVTAAGVTAGIDLGLHLVERLAGLEARSRIAAQMEAVVT